MGEDGQYIKTIEYKYSATIRYGNHSTPYLSELFEKINPSETIGADTLEELENKLRSKCHALRGQTYDELSYPEELEQGDDSGPIVQTDFSSNTKLYGRFECSAKFNGNNNNGDGDGILPAVAVSFGGSYGLGHKEWLCLDIPLAFYPLSDKIAVPI